MCHTSSGASSAICARIFSESRSTSLLTISRLKSSDPLPRYPAESFSVAMRIVEGSRMTLKLKATLLELTDFHLDSLRNGDSLKCVEIRLTLIN